MKVDISNALTIILGLIALVGAIYRLVQVESNINARISRLEVSVLLVVDTAKDDLVDKINVADKKIDIHLAKYEADKEYIYLYRLNATDKLVVHKFNRLANWTTQIAAFLHRQSGFQLRDDKF